MGLGKKVWLAYRISHKLLVQVRLCTIPSYPPSKNTYASVEEYGFVTCVLGGV